MKTINTLYHHLNKILGPSVDGFVSSSINTGFTNIDQQLNGLQLGELYVLGGAAAMGTKTMAKELALRVANHSGVLFLPQVESLNELTKKLLCIEGDIQLCSIEKQPWDTKLSSKVSKTMKAFKQKKFYLKNVWQYTEDDFFQLLEDYITHKILIISESHYVPDKFDEDISNWYENPTQELVNAMKGNTNTRGVISNFFDKDKKGHRLFHNLNAALNNASEGLNMKNVAWYNFYQKPAKHKTEFNKANSKDKKVAIEVFEENIKVLDPKLIIFVSKNSFGSLQKGEGGKKDRIWCSILKGHKFKNHEVPIHVVVHPNSSWWNRKHDERNETGKQQNNNLKEK